MIIRLCLLAACVSVTVAFVPNIHAGNQSLVKFVLAGALTVVHQHLHPSDLLRAGSLVIPDFDAIRGMHLPPPQSEYFNPWSPDGNPQSLPYRFASIRLFRAAADHTPHDRPPSNSNIRSASCPPKGRTCPAFLVLCVAGGVRWSSTVLDAGSALRRICCATQRARPFAHRRMSKSVSKAISEGEDMDDPDVGGGTTLVAPAPPPDPTAPARPQLQYGAHSGGPRAHREGHLREREGKDS